MTKRVSVDAATIRILYYRYKEFLVPVGAILVCLLIGYFLIIPQTSSWFALRDTVALEQQKLATLTQNVHFVSTLSKESVDKELQIASATLPPTKDFAGIITSLSQAAQASGVGIGDYSFQVGDIAAINPGSQFSLQITFGASGDIKSIANFITKLKEQAPLANVTAVTIRPSGGTNMTALFYYFPLPRIQFSGIVALSPLSPSQNQLLTTISGWNTNVLQTNTEVTNQVIVPTSTTSGRLQ